MTLSISSPNRAAAVVAPILALALAGVAQPAWAGATYVFDVTNYGPIPPPNPDDYDPGTVVTLHDAPVPSSFSLAITVGAITFQHALDPNLYLSNFYDGTITDVPGLDQALATAGATASQLKNTVVIVQYPQFGWDNALFQSFYVSPDDTQAVELNLHGDLAPLQDPPGSPLAPFTPQQLANLFARSGVFSFEVTGSTDVFAGPDNHQVIDATDFIGTAVFDAAASGFAVPEPAAWALMLTGFGLAGAALRRRRAAGAAMSRHYRLN